jgi:hypothetical protein
MLRNLVDDTSHVWGLWCRTMVRSLSFQSKTCSRSVQCADKHHDRIHRGREKSENGRQVALESVCRAVWHCVARHCENAAQRDAKLTWRPILRHHFSIYLGLFVYGHVVCLRSLHSSAHAVCKQSHEGSTLPRNEVPCEFLRS